MYSKVENANSVPAWAPEDYMVAAGSSLSKKPPSAMDFMSRLNSDITVSLHVCFSFALLQFKI